MFSQMFRGNQIVMAWLTETNMVPSLSISFIIQRKYDVLHDQIQLTHQLNVNRWLTNCTAYTFMIHMHKQHRKIQQLFVIIWRLQFFFHMQSDH